MYQTHRLNTATARSRALSPKEVLVCSQSGSMRIIVGDLGMVIFDMSCKLVKIVETNVAAAETMPKVGFQSR